MNVTAEQVFALLPADPAERREHAAVVYRCKRAGCVMAEVYTAPGFTLIHQGEFKVSPALDSATSTPEARETKQDARGRWEARTYFLHEAVNPVFYCRHIFHLSLPNERIEGDVKRRAGAVRLDKADAAFPPPTGTADRA